MEHEKGNGVDKMRNWLLDDDATADSSINDRLVKLRSLIDQTRFEFIDISDFGAVNFLSQNIPDAAFC